MGSLKTQNLVTNVELSGDCIHAKFDRNRFISVWIHANLKVKIALVFLASTILTIK